MNYFSKHILKVAIVMSVFIGLQFFLWGWIKQSANRLYDRRTASQQLQNLEALLADAAQTQEAEAALVQQMTAVLISSDRLTQAVERLERQADRQGLATNITSLVHQGTDDEITDSGLLDALEVTLTVRGDPIQLLAYLEAVEHFPEVNYVVEWQLQPAAISSGLEESQVQGSHTLSLRVRYYVMADEGSEGIPTAVPIDIEPPN